MMRHLYENVVMIEVTVYGEWFKCLPLQQLLDESTPHPLYVLDFPV